MTALTHSSYAAEHDVESNERLEFLGDAVVDLAIADLIVTALPRTQRGFSGSLVRRRVVNEASLARAARASSWSDALRVGRGVKKENGAARPSLLADAFEAVVAALYFERGYEVARDLRARRPGRRRRDAAPKAPGDVDPKTRLRQWAESRRAWAPRATTWSARVRSHDVTFSRDVRAGISRLAGRGSLEEDRRGPRGSRGLAERLTMPELPEVETVRASLARDLVGKKIKTVIVTNGASVRRHKSREGLPRPGRGPQHAAAWAASASTSSSGSTTPATSSSTWA